MQGFVLFKFQMEIVMPKTKGAKKALKNFQDQYGKKKGKQIYYATANKQDRDPDTFHKESNDEIHNAIKSIVVDWYSDPANNNKEELAEYFLEFGPESMASDILDAAIDSGKINVDDSGMITNLGNIGVKEFVNIVSKMVEDHVFAMFESKCTLKQDIFIEHNGQMITIPEGTILQEMAVGTGAIAMVPAALGSGKSAKGGAVAMDKPKKSKVGKKKKKEVDEASNSQISPLQQDH